MNEWKEEANFQELPSLKRVGLEFIFNKIDQRKEVNKQTALLLPRRRFNVFLQEQCHNDMSLKFSKTWERSEE